jgi:hypothetical protein
MKVLFQPVPAVLMYSHQEYPGCMVSTHVSKATDNARAAASSIPAHVVMGPFIMPEESISRGEQLGSGYRFISMRRLP